MKSRSKKYLNQGKSKKKTGVDTTSATESKKKKPVVKPNVATQDDTGGGNESGKRIDDN